MSKFPTSIDGDGAEWPPELLECFLHVIDQDDAPTGRITGANYNPPIDSFTYIVDNKAYAVSKKPAIEFIGYTRELTEDEL